MSSKNKSFQLSSSPKHSGSKPGVPGVSRNSEMNNPLRRSFTGNPFVKPSIVANSRGFNPITPANSPSDYTIRKSISREGLASLRDFEDKENGKDPNLKPGKVRSPAASKGTKNFMSPTISAASKIAPSPKKKVLIEKTEPARTSTTVLNAKSPRSVSFADFVEEIISKPEMDEYEEQTEACHDVTVTDMEKEVADENELSSKSVESETVLDSLASLSSQKDVQPPDTIVLEEDFADDHASSVIHDSPISEPALAPLDADPSMPPYDPRNNYLSPRPQFLHYKPNPRIGYYLNRDGTRVGDGIFSECFSDSETPSEDSEIESEDASSGEAAVTDEEVEVQFPEINTAEQLTMQEKMEANVASKSRIFTRFRFITLLLVGLVAFSSFAVNNYPVTQPSAFEDSSLSRLYIPPEISDFARETMNVIAHNFQQWWLNSLSEVSKLILRFKSTHGNGLMLYSNLTVMYNDPIADGYAGFNHRNTIEPIYVREVIEQTLEDHSSVDAELEGNGDPDYEEQLCREALVCDTREFEEQPVTGTSLTSNDVLAYDDQLHQLGDTSEGCPEDVVEVNIAESKKPESHLAVHSKSEFSANEVSLELLIRTEQSEPSEQHILQDAVEVNTAESKKPESHLALGSNSEFSAKEVFPDLLIRTSETLEQHVTNDGGSSAQAVLTEIENIPENLELEASNAHSEVLQKQDSSLVTLEEKISINHLLAAFFLVMSLAAIIFVFTKKAKLSAARALSAPVVPKKSETIPIDEQTFYQRPSSDQPTEVDIAGGSCPSEMSSFLNNGSSGAGEAQSQGRRRPRKNFRRESLASSDISLGDSPSFGSFTTYEKISSKLGEDEVITPVRRSSRIRKQVTSS